MPTARFNDLEEFVLAWEDGGLQPKMIAPVRDAVERSAEIAREAKVVQDATTLAARRVGLRIAEGELDYEAGLAEVGRLLRFDQAAAVGTSTPIGPILRDDARAACHKAARAFVVANAAELRAKAETASEPEATYLRSWLTRFAGSVSR